MTNLPISRRTFLKGTLGAAALAGFPGRLLTLPGRRADTNQSILVLVSLRGGWDALNVVVPGTGVDGEIYEKARPSIKIPVKKLIQLDDRFGLHPALSPLAELYRNGSLAIVHAAGLTSDTRSHFDAVEHIETGSPDQKNLRTGWMARAWQALALQEEGIPLVSIPERPTALIGLNSVISLTEIGDLARWDPGYVQQQNQILAKLYGGTGPLQEGVQHTLRVMETGAGLMTNGIEHTNNVKYADDEFGRAMKTVAQLAKSDSGLRFATVDYGGWDTHQWENDGAGGKLADLLASLGNGLNALYDDMYPLYANRVTVVVMSEFGRRLAQNDSGGTDHGHGGVMMVLGAGVKGGQVYGEWPGLQTDQLYDRADLQVTTDYRVIINEVLANRFDLREDAGVFPGYAPQQTIGLMEG